MTYETSYTKTDAQIKLESILHFFINELHFSSISQIKEEIESECANCELSTLYTEFKSTLAEVITILACEQKTHTLINSISKAFGSRYDQELHEYEFFFEVINNCYLGLFNVISRTGTVKKDDLIIVVNNVGRMRIDTYLDKSPEYFVCTLRHYLRNNITKDCARHHNVEIKHIECDTVEVFNEYDENISKIDSIKYNSHNIDNDFESRLVSRISYSSDLCSSLIISVIERFAKRKPVACYIYLRILLGNYNVKKTVSELNTRDFNELMAEVLYELKEVFSVNLHEFRSMEFNDDTYINSFRSVHGETEEEVFKIQRDRLDRLASDTRKIVLELKSFKDAEANYVDYSASRKTFSL